METETETRTQRRTIKCSLCGKTGHNVRSCTLFDTVRAEAITQYMIWLSYCLRGYPTKWASESYAAEMSPEMLESLRNSTALSLTDMWKEPIPWLKNIDDLNLKCLTHGYHINKKGTKQRRLELLHYTFISESDKTWLLTNDTKESVVPYIVSSSNFIVELQWANDQIFQYVDVMTEEFALLHETPNSTYRQDRLRLLYNTNVRSVRYFNQDLNRYDRQIRDNQRHMVRMQAEMIRLQDKRETILQRRRSVMAELLLFPPLLTKPQIEFVEKAIIHSIECAICYENIKAKNVTHLNCEHSFCIHCIMNTVLTQYKSVEHKLECNCPICREKIKTIFGNVGKLKDRLQHQMAANRINADISDLIG
jgi:hypothetical protein